MQNIIIGVDVSKDFLDVYVRPTSVRKRFANNAAGIAAFVIWAGMLILSTLYPTSEWVVEDEASAGTRPVNAWTP